MAYDVRDLKNSETVGGGDGETTPAGRPDRWPSTSVGLAGNFLTCIRLQGYVKKGLFGLLCFLQLDLPKSNDAIHHIFSSGQWSVGRSAIQLRAMRARACVSFISPLPLKAAGVNLGDEKLRLVSVGAVAAVTCARHVRTKSFRLRRAAAAAAGTGLTGSSQEGREGDGLAMPEVVSAARPSPTEYTLCLVIRKEIILHSVAPLQCWLF